MHLLLYYIRESPVARSFFFLMIRRPPRSTLDRSSAASDVYKRQAFTGVLAAVFVDRFERKRLLLTMFALFALATLACGLAPGYWSLLLSLIHISEPTRPY